MTVAPRWCGICGTDLHEYTSGPIVTPSSPHPLTGATLPQILGHELSAEVVAVGTAVNRVEVGDRVSVMPLIYCGRCDYCRRGLQHLCITMACTGLSADWGGIAELANLEEYQVFRIPDAVSDEQGALIEPCAVAAYGVSRGAGAPGRQRAHRRRRTDRGVRGAVRRGSRGRLGLHDRAERVAA